MYGQAVSKMTKVLLPQGLCSLGARREQTSLEVNEKREERKSINKKA